MNEIFEQIKAKIDSTDKSATQCLLELAAKAKELPIEMKLIAIGGVNSTEIENRYKELCIETAAICVSFLLKLGTSFSFDKGGGCSRTVIRVFDIIAAKDRYFSVGDKVAYIHSGEHAIILNENEIEFESGVKHINWTKNVHKYELV